MSCPQKSKRGGGGGNSRELYIERYMSKVIKLIRHAVLFLILILFHLPAYKLNVFYSLKNLVTILFP